MRTTPRTSTSARPASGRGGRPATSRPCAHSTRRHGRRRSIRSKAWFCTSRNPGSWKRPNRSREDQIMSQMTETMNPMPMHEHADAGHVLRRTIVIGLTAFLTVVDLFATQAILPSLAKAYHVAPAAMGLAVNASTLGMAVAGLAVAFFSRRIDRRFGILLSLALLSI